jgi:hypothetical protein
VNGHVRAISCERPGLTSVAGLQSWYGDHSLVSHAWSLQPHSIEQSGGKAADTSMHGAEVAVQVCPPRLCMQHPVSGIPAFSQSTQVSAVCSQAQGHSHAMQSTEHSRG